MRPEALDPVHVRRLRQMSPEERLRAAFGLGEMVERLGRAGSDHRRTERDDAAAASAGT